jgi:hypothetical protein
MGGRRRRCRRYRADRGRREEILKDQDSYSPRAVLVGLLVCLLLVLGGLFLVYALRDTSQMQDCVMQGRSNCAPVETPAGS